MSKLICFIGLIILVILWIIASRYGKHGCFNPNRRPERRKVFRNDGLE